MKKKAKQFVKAKLLLPIIIVVIFLLLLFGVIFTITTIFTDDEGGDGIGLGGTAMLNEEVEGLRPLFEKYAKLHGIPDQVELLMALTMQESGGRHLDVMQSSESLGLPPNSIVRPEKSIDVGVRYFSQMLQQAKGDVKLALQGYNFGGGFIGYAMNNGGKYSIELARKFSRLQAEKLGWDSYGDVNYVSNVMRYMTGVNQNPEFGGDWAYPVKNIIITSRYGMRSDPFSGKSTMHSGLDFDCDYSDYIYAVQDGTVVESVSMHRSWGNYVKVKHNNNEYSLYAHMSRLGVKKGDRIKVGQSVGVCGTTGNSTGTHLHLEYYLNGERKNPELKLSK